MEISPTQLRQMADDVDTLHHESMRTFAEASADLHGDLVAQASRRTFLRRGGAGIGAVALAGAGASGVSPLLAAHPAAAQGGLTDTAIAGFAQSIELAAVVAYEAGAAALSGDTRAVAELFASHHQDHANAFGAVAGPDARPEPNARLVAEVTPTLEAVAAAVADGQDVTADVLSFAMVVENQASYTYAAALTLLQDPAYAAATATIMPIEAQHATVLALALGLDADAWFPTGAFESAAIGDGSNPDAGFDPAAFG